MVARPAAHKDARAMREDARAVREDARAARVMPLAPALPAPPSGPRRPQDTGTAFPAPPRPRDAFVSASDYAYATLREEIVAGRFAPGRRLREIQLSEWLGISRTPLRHALSRLEVEGLLAVKPRAGLVVACLDDQAVFELYETREALEGTAAALAARHAGEHDIARLQGLVSLKQAVVPAALYQRNREFHEAIYLAAHNRFLLKSLQALHDALALLGPTTLSVEGRPEQAQREHARIVAAICRRDAAGAEAEARAHIRNGFPLRRAIRAGQRG